MTMTKQPLTTITKNIANELFLLLILMTAGIGFAGSDMITVSDDVVITNEAASSGIADAAVFFGDKAKRDYLVLRFDTHPVDEVTHTELLLDLNSYTVWSGTLPASATYLVWGVPDLGDIDEDDFSFSSYAYLFGNTTYGVNPSHASGNAPLAQFTVTAADRYHTVSISSSALDSYIEAHAGNDLALVISWQENQGDLISSFATKERGEQRPPRLFVTMPDKFFTPSDDTYGLIGSSANYGSAGSISVKQSGGGSGSTVRKGVIEFTVPDSMAAADAALLLDLSGFNDSAGATTAKFYVWGVRDGSSLENINEDTFKYATYDAFFNSGTDGVANSNDSVHDGDPEQDNAQSLGTFTVNINQVGETIEFRSNALLDFVNSNYNTKITFVLTRYTNSGSLNTSFASKENANFNPPTLYVRPLAEKQTPGPSTSLVYYDVDDDSEMDLVMMVDLPEGSGYLVAEPFVIADYLERTGLGLGSGADFYNKLSSSQKQSLHNTLYTLANNDCVQQATSSAITASQLLTQIANLPNDREYPVTEFTSMATLETDLAAGYISVAVSYPSCTIYEYSHGDLTVAINGPSAQAGLSVSANGAAFGAEYTLYSVSASYGNENGTYAGVSAGAGAGFWAQASWGQQGQYGATVPVPGTALSVSVYIKGEDAVSCYDACRYSLGSTVANTADWFEEGWNDDIDWSNDTLVVVENTVQQYRLFMERNHNHAKVYVDHLGEQTTVLYRGSASNVTSALNNTSNSATNLSSNAADGVAAAGQSAGSTTVSAWDATIGWTVGAWNTAWNGVKFW